MSWWWGRRGGLGAQDEPGRRVAPLAAMKQWGAAPSAKTTAGAVEAVPKRAARAKERMKEEGKEMNCRAKCRRGGRAAGV